MSDKTLDLGFEIKETYKSCPFSVSELEAKMKLFLVAYLKYGVISKACEVAGISRKTYKVWLEHYPQFEERFREIELEYTEKLEMEANKRALEKSDRLLEFLLKARNPEKFNPAYKVNATVETSGIKLVFTNDELSEEEKKILLQQDELGDD